MSFNYQDDEEDYKYLNEYQQESLESNFLLNTDLYNTIDQFHFSFRNSFKKANTGQSKHIRKMKQLRKFKRISQYENEVKNIVSGSFFQMAEEALQNNSVKDKQQKEIKMIAKEIKQLKLY